MARWLVHGVAQNDQEIIDDALGMLDGLVEELASGSLRPLTATAAAAAALAAQSAFIAASEAQEQSAFVSDATQEIAIVTEEVAIVADEADEVVELEPDDAEEPEVSAGDNTKTRVIELPEKGENELF
jgi:hypothetical protein